MFHNKIVFLVFICNKTSQCNIFAMTKGAIQVDESESDSGSGVETDPDQETSAIESESAASADDSDSSTKLIEQVMAKKPVPSVKHGKKEDKTHCRQEAL